MPWSECFHARTIATKRCVWCAQAYMDLLVGTGFNGKIVTGVEVPPECCGHTLTIDEVNSVADWQNANSGGGAMLWYLGPRKTSSPSPTQVMQAFCTKFSFGGCNQPLYTCDVRGPAPCLPRLGGGPSLTSERHTGQSPINVGLQSCKVFRTHV